MKMFLIALCTVFLSLPAFADENAVVNGTRYQLDTSQVLLRPGEVREVGKECPETVSGYNRITTCTWEKTVRATADGIVVTDGEKSVVTELREELVVGVLSILLMLLAGVLRYAHFDKHLGIVSVFPSAFTTLYFALLAVGYFGALGAFAIAPVYAAYKVVRALHVLRFAPVFLTDNGIAAAAVLVIRNEVFIRAITAHIALMVFVLVLLY